eukprot:CAMPEP_0172911040 /NCGR_PEP_ID=MMETSP1075-20121228/185782_1 /TAXON_ID=2916 /ORGANISM="Ceratium fusus, Strain PA161109" /LENGTH=60 /DNA_ID=CAMNT_0013769279 /DNA_START=42 /DNA_END=221 /DNA_ORIENTATION=+
MAVFGQDHPQSMEEITHHLVVSEIKFVHRIFAASMYMGAGSQIPRDLGCDPPGLGKEPQA